MPWTFTGFRTGDYKIFDMPYGRVAIAINGNYVCPVPGWRMRNHGMELFIDREELDRDDDDFDEDLDASHRFKYI